MRPGKILQNATPRVPGLGSSGAVRAEIGPALHPRGSSVSLAIVAGICVVGCGLRPVAGPSGREQVVVQGVLDAGAAEQLLWVERTVPAGAPIGLGLHPLATPPSRVEVRDSTGAVFAFQVDSANPARFLGRFTPHPEWCYELLIEAGAAVLRATTRVPATLTIIDPSADTVFISRNGTLRLAWTGPRRWVRVTQADSSGQRFESFPQWVSNDTVANVSSFPPDPEVSVWVLAVDSVTARSADAFGISPDPGLVEIVGNVSGGVGFFGAATSDRVVVRFQ